MKRRFLMYPASPLSNLTLERRAMDSASNASRFDTAKGRRGAVLVFCCLLASPFPPRDFSEGSSVRLAPLPEETSAPRGRLRFTRSRDAAHAAPGQARRAPGFVALSQPRSTTAGRPPVRDFIRGWGLGRGGEGGPDRRCCHRSRRGHTRRGAVRVRAT